MKESDKPYFIISYFADAFLHNILLGLLVR